MNSAAILDQLQSVFRDVFDDDSITLTEETTARDIRGWDSVANIRMILSVENEFDVRFDTGEISEFRNVGDLRDAIARLKA